MEGMAEQKRDRSAVYTERARQGNTEYVALIQSSLRAAPFSASFEDDWDNLDPLTFRVLGAIVRRAPDGSPCFNFSQTIWLYPKTSMNWSTRLTRHVETLAVNLLAPWISGRKQRSVGLTAEQLAIVVSRAFAREFLCTMPDDGGCIPREVIQEWLRSAL